MTSARQWADDLLGRLGAPRNTSNEQLLVAWQEGEATKAAFNPLATTQSAPGDSYFNSFGPHGMYHVRNYPNYQTGLDATVKTLRNGNYPTILSGLLLGDAGLATSAPGQYDKWGTGGSKVISHLAHARANWPAEGDELLPSMPGAAQSVDTSALPGGMRAKSPGLSDVPTAASALVSGAGGLVPDIGTDLKSVLIFVVLVGGALGLVLIGAQRAAAPITPHIDPQALAAIGAAA